MADANQDTKQTSSDKDSAPSAPVSTVETVSKDQYDALEGRFNQLTSALNQYFAQAQNVPANVPSKLPEADLLLTDPAKWQADYTRTLGASVAQYVTQATTATLNGSTKTAQALSKMDSEYKDTWAKYGKEIEELASSPQIPLAMKADKDFWDNTAMVVRGKHLKEIAKEMATSQAQELVAQMNSTTGSQSGFEPTKVEAKGIEALKNTAYGKALLERYTPRQIAENVAKMKMSIEDFATATDKTQVQRKPGDPNEWRVIHDN